MEIFLGLPKEFLLDRYVAEQHNFAHVVRLHCGLEKGHRSGYADDFDLITENIYSLRKLQDVSDHYRRSALRTLIIIEARSMKRLLREWEDLLEDLAINARNLTVYLWMPHMARDGVSPGSNLLRHVDKIFYADTPTLFSVLPSIAGNANGLLVPEIGEEREIESFDEVFYCLELSKSGGLSTSKSILKRIPKPDPVSRNQIRTYRTLSKIK